MKLTNDNTGIGPKKTRYSIVLGSYVRSRNACINCKKSKKKCDEKLPTCGLCLKRKLVCGYKNDKKLSTGGISLGSYGGNEGSKRVGMDMNSSNVPDESIEVGPKSVPGSNIRHQKYYNNQNQNHENINALVPYSTNSSTPPDSSPLIELDNQSIHDSNIPVLLPNSLWITSQFNVYLDANGLQFLQYFEEKVSNLLCIDDNTNNYLLKTFLTMSLTEESISHALACWGGIFKESNGLNNTLVRRHYNKSISLISNLNINNNSFNYYILLCFHQILMGIKICLGDVQDWFKIFNNCYKLITKNGGISALLNLFKNSNDIKWLISNFQYHDILQSNSFKTGTRFPIEDYRLNYIDYGIDPFQGCHNSMILLLGELLNYRLTNVDYNDLNSLQVFYDKFDEKIKQCKPLDYQLNLLLESDRSNYLRLFDLYKVTVKIILLMHGKLMNPKCLDMQLLVGQGLSLTEMIIESNLFSSLTFPLFYLGINATIQNHQVFLKLLDKTYEGYNVGNLIRVKQFVLLYWERNPDGEKFLNWLDLVDELNWELYTG